MHDLLKSQIERLLGPVDSLPKELGPLLEAIEATYASFDEDRERAERSLELDAARRLAHSESVMKATIESTADGILVVNRQGAIVYFNQKFVEMWRIPREIAEAREDERALAFVLDQLREPESFLSTVRELYASPEKQIRDVLEFKDGRIFERYSKPQLLGGEYVGRVWSFRDVTAERRAARELDSQKSFLRQIIDLDPNFIFAKDREGRFTLANRAVAEAYGTTAEGLLGKTDADFNPNREEVEHFRKDDLEVIDTRRDKIVLEEKVTDAAGNVRLLQTIKRAIVSEDGTANQVLGVATDITERTKLQEQLLQSQKMEAIGLLAGGVAHDFNNLLNVIGGYTELAVSRLDSSHPARDNLQKVATAAKRASDLTGKLLAFSRRQILQVRPHDIHSVLEGFSRMFGSILGEDIEVSVAPSPGPLVVRADAGQLDQVLLNLCTNARQAMPRGGRIEIETCRATLDRAALTAHPWVEPGEFLKLTVRDNGTGMEGPTLERIFEPFFTTKSDGTGLGLPTVYGIVRQHHGFVEVASRLGHGSAFHVHLPLVDAPPSVEATDSPAETPGGREIILVAEDEPMLRDLVDETLTAFGYRVILADDGQRALDEFRRRLGEIDLVVLDVVMPRLSGPDAFLEMRASHPELRAVFMSGHAPDSVHLADILERDGVCFVPKPFSPQTLATKIREVLDRTRHARRA